MPVFLLQDGVCQPELHYVAYYGHCNHDDEQFQARPLLKTRLRQEVRPQTQDGKRAEHGQDRQLQGVDDYFDL